MNCRFERRRSADLGHSLPATDHDLLRSYILTHQHFNGIQFQSFGDWAWPGPLDITDSETSEQKSLMSAASCLWELMALIVQFGLSSLAIALAFMETISSLSFEALFSVFGLWPTVTFRAQDSAVLILNAEDGKPVDVINHVLGRYVHYPRYRAERLSQILGAWVHRLRSVSRPPAPLDWSA